MAMKKKAKKKVAKKKSSSKHGRPKTARKGDLAKSKFTTHLAAGPRGPGDDEDD